MKEKITILIADDNIEFAKTLVKFLKTQEDMSAIGVAKDGNEALDMISNLKPDVVLLDVIMPHLDGIGVLERLKMVKMDKKPTIIMLSAVGQDKITKKSISLGAEYYVVKPFDIELLITRIREIKNFKPDEGENFIDGRPRNPKLQYIEVNNQIDFDATLEVCVTNMIHRVGVPAHIKGYKFLREAIIMVVKDIDKINQVTKGVYPKIALKYETIPSRVERSIRHAIEIAWGRGERELVENIFGNIIPGESRKPTNTEFIAMLSDKIRLELKNC